jgi:hypothetical protein
MKKKVLQAKKNHHYVWAHYLARWSVDGKNVWHTTPTGKVVRDSVRAIAQEKYFYKSKELTMNHIQIIKFLSSFSPKSQQVQHEAFLSDFLTVQKLSAVYRANGVPNLEIDEAFNAIRCNMMEDLHSFHESEVQSIIDRLISGDISILSAEDNQIKLFEFLGHQIARTKNFKETFFTSTLAAFQINGDAIQVRELIEDCWRFISYMFGMNIGLELYATRHSRIHCLLINDSEKGFISSDHPVINVHQNLKEELVISPTDEECDFFFPLSPKVAHMINKSDVFSPGMSMISEEIVMEMNQKIAKSARTYIVGADRDTVALYSKLVGTRNAIVKSHFGQL